MDLESAIRFLKNNQPLSNDLELEESIIEQYDEIRKFFLLNPNPKCIPLFLNSFGEGSGFGVYQLVEDVLLNFSNEEVVPHLKNSLCSQHKGVRYWSTQIASSFPNSELINPCLHHRRNTLKKFRGKKRYFRNLWKKVSGFDLDFDNDSWFDFWHIHLDFWGRGNDSLKVRREHIKAHITLYNNILNGLEKFEKPYQSWVCIHEEDTGADAVYIHTPNPNDDYFPHKIDELQWNCKVPSMFSDLINLNKFNVGYYKSDYEEVYYIQSKQHGIKL